MNFIATRCPGSSNVRPCGQFGSPDAPPEDCGGIWAVNEFQAGLADTFDAAEVTRRLAGLAEILIPASATRTVTPT